MWGLMHAGEKHQEKGFPFISEHGIFRELDSAQLDPSSLHSQMLSCDLAAGKMKWSSRAPGKEQTLKVEICFPVVIS